MFFLLFAAFAMFLSWSNPTTDSGNIVWIATGAIGILLISVLVHELGHFSAAMHFGGEGQPLVLWPLGGLCPQTAPVDPRHELIMHLAGPLVNLGICLASGIVVATRIGTEWTGLLHPLAPRSLFLPADVGAVLLTAKLTFWINWVLLLVNLLPAFPFDGGRVLRSALIAMNPEIRPRRAAYIVATLAKFVALGLLIFAVLSWSDKTNPVMPVWFSLVLLAMFLFFSARQEEERTEDSEPDEELFGYDFSQGYTSLERTSEENKERISPFRRWLEERRRNRALRQRQLEVYEERREDDILSRLHDAGIDSLSAEDRALLKRVSERLRHRQGKE
jgi:Zn-dependent protease